MRWLDKSRFYPNLRQIKSQKIKSLSWFCGSVYFDNVINNYITHFTFVALDNLGLEMWNYKNKIIFND